MQSLFEKRPECPGEREDYVWVTTRKGGHWRKKRGRVKKATLNPVFEKNAGSTGMTNAAAGRVLQSLLPYLRGIKKGDFYTRLAGKLKKAYNLNGYLNFTLAKEMEVQDEYPMAKLLRAGYRVEKQNGKAVVSIPIDEQTVKQHNELITDYYFELLMLYGDVTVNEGLTIDYVISDVYPIKPLTRTDCVMQLDIPGEPWMLILKLSSIEGHELAYAWRNYGMKIVECGEGRQMGEGLGFKV